MAEVIDHETERPSEEALADLLEAARENDADAQEELARHGLWPEEKEHEAEEAEADVEACSHATKLGNPAQPNLTGPTQPAAPCRKASQPVSPQPAKPQIQVARIQDRRCELSKQQQRTASSLSAVAQQLRKLLAASSSSSRLSLPVRGKSRASPASRARSTAWK